MAQCPSHDDEDEMLIVVKSDLIEAVAKRTEAPVVACTTIINEFLDLIVAQVAQERKVELRGFGQFLPIMKAARKGRHPVTGEQIAIPPCRGLKFREGSNMLKALGKD